MNRQERFHLRQHELGACRCGKEPARALEAAVEAEIRAAIEESWAALRAKGIENVWIGMPGDIQIIPIPREPSAPFLDDDGKLWEGPVQDPDDPRACLQSIPDALVRAVDRVLETFEMATDEELAQELATDPIGALEAQAEARGGVDTREDNREIKLAMDESAPRDVFIVKGGFFSKKLERLK